MLPASFLWGLAGFASALAGEAATPTLNRASAATMTTAELARRVLDADRAASVVAHELENPTFPGGPLGGIRFFARPQAAGNGLCRRQSYYVSLAPMAEANEETMRSDVPVRLERVQPGVQVALAGDCRLGSGDGFAWIHPASAEEEAMQALLSLSALQERTRRGAVDFVVSCTSDFRPDPCADGSAAALGNLPLNKTYIIEATEVGSPGWRFAVMPAGPGQPYWNVLLHSDADSVRVSLKWQAPAPF